LRGWPQQGATSLRNRQGPLAFRRLGISREQAKRLIYELL
jgi:hypothetical protein